MDWQEGNVMCAPDDNNGGNDYCGPDADPNEA